MYETNSMTKQSKSIPSSRNIKHQRKNRREKHRDPSSNINDDDDEDDDHRQQEQQQCLCFQDVMESYQQKQRKQQHQEGGGMDDHEVDDIAAHVFFELANAPMVSYRIDNINNITGKEAEINDGKKKKEKKSKSKGEVKTTMIRIHQDHADACGNHTGGIVWETSYLLLNYLRQKYLFFGMDMSEEEEGTRPGGLSSSSASSYPCGKTVVEVGAGCGLLGLGIYHSKLAERVILTETDSVLPNLKRNVQNNYHCSSSSSSKKQTVEESSSSKADDNIMVRACALDWTRYKEDCQACHYYLEPHSVDMIVGTDVVFSTRFVGPLLDTLRYLAHAETTILLCLQERCPDAHQLLLESANNHGLSVQDISEQVTEVPTCEWGRDLDCCILQLRVVDDVDVGEITKMDQSPEKPKKKKQKLLV